MAKQQPIAQVRIGSNRAAHLEERERLDLAITVAASLLLGVVLFFPHGARRSSHASTRMESPR